MTLTNKLKEMRRQEEGFTIVELLIVIVVIAILAALVITSYLGIQSRARDSERQSDIRNIATAVQADATLNDGEYPSCADISTGAVDNIDAEAIVPPNAADPAWITTGPATAPGNYGCEANTSGTTVIGVTLSYWAENPGDATNPITRDLGDVD